MPGNHRPDPDTAGHLRPGDLLLYDGAWLRIATITADAQRITADSQRSRATGAGTGTGATARLRVVAHSLGGQEMTLWLWKEQPVLARAAEGTKD